MINHVIDLVVAPAATGLWSFLTTTVLLQAVGTSDPFADLLGLGVGGAVALVVLWWKRQDDKEHREEKEKQAKDYETRLESILDKNREREERTNQALLAISKTTSELSEVIKELTDRAGLAEKLDQVLKEVKKE